MTSYLTRLRLPLLAALIAIGAAAFIYTRPAGAHSRPIRFDPPESSVLTTPPTQITGWFNSPIRRDPNWSFIHVTDATGNRVDGGDSNLSTDRMSMTETLKPSLPQGRYLVTWRTYDDGDGEIFGNCFTIFVGQQAADQAQQAKYRLDGGKDCSPIEISGKNGTPTADQLTANATAVAGGQADEADDSSSSSSGGGGSSTGKLIIGLVVGALAGVVVGGGGVKLLTGRKPS